MKISEVIRDCISDDCWELLNTVIYILIMSSGQCIDQTKLLNGLAEWENMFFMCFVYPSIYWWFYFPCIIQHIQNGDTSGSDHRTPSVVLDIESLAQSSDFCSGSPKMTVSSFLFIVNLGSSSHKMYTNCSRQHTSLGFSLVYLSLFIFLLEGTIAEMVLSSREID